MIDFLWPVRAFLFAWHKRRAFRLRRDASWHAAQVSDLRTRALLHDGRAALLFPARAPPAFGRPPETGRPPPSDGDVLGP